MDRASRACLNFSFSFAHTTTNLTCEVAPLLSILHRCPQLTFSSSSSQSTLIGVRVILFACGARMGILRCSLASYAPRNYPARPCVINHRFGLLQDLRAMGHLLLAIPHHQTLHPTPCARDLVRLVGWHSMPCSRNDCPRATRWVLIYSIGFGSDCCCWLLILALHPTAGKVFEHERGGRCRGAC